MSAEPDTVPTEGRLPGDLASELARRGIRVTGPMGPGASCTRLYHARSRSGEPLVVKVLRQADDPVDGHDLATFRAKKLQIDRLRSWTPGLSSCYVPITEEISGTAWAVHVMPYVAGEDLLASARAGQLGAARCAQLIARLLARLSVSGYAYQQRPADPDAPVLGHAERIRRRLRFLEPALIPAAAIRGTGCRINGRPCPPLLPLLETLTTSPRLRAILSPRLVSPPVHGDLNTRNVLVRHGTGQAGTGTEFALIDPRGTLELIDIGYDLGKLILSATLWDPLLRLPASVLPAGPGDGDVLVTVPIFPGYAELLSRLPAVLGATRPLSDLLDRTGGWRARLAFIHAVHAVAEAACRVSDARARGLPPGDRQLTHTVRAFYFTGLLLLSDLCSRLQAADDIDLDEHLHILRRVHRLVPAPASLGAAFIMGYEFPVADPCPACQWLSGREPWVPVFTTELATSYVASRQRTHGTVCVIPKRHVRRLAEFTGPELTQVSQILRDVIRGIEAAYAPDALHTWISTGSLASQHRPHAHINVVPRRVGEPYTFEASFGLARVPVAERQKIADEIIEGLSRAS